MGLFDTKISIRRVTCELRLVMTVDFLNRDRIRQYIKDLSFSKDVKLDIEDDRGFMSSTFRIRLTGQLDVVKEVIDALEELVRPEEEPVL